ncbi:MAG: rRNA maturation RNase YbeY [Bryobacter sp.]|nr:rRNA maturation RNase YbeY [Bryobacter sp.]
MIFSRRLEAGLRRQLREFAQTLSDDWAEGRPFSCLIGGDRRLRQLNRDFLGHDYATDVLSFPLQLGEEELGEIAISVDRAQEQAGERGHTLDMELKILLLHGFLHLLGHDHEKDQGGMRRLEAKLRRKYGLKESLIERASNKGAKL